MVTLKHLDNGMRLILSPNRSATWPQAKVYCLIFGCPCLLIALSWLWAGAWLILPFAGLELMLLFGLMRYVNGQNLRKEVIDIIPGKVVVTVGNRQPESSTVLNRPMAHVCVTHPKHPIGEKEIHLADGNKSITIGGFLNQDDRAQLEALLQSSGLMICLDRWW